MGSLTSRPDMPSQPQTVTYVQAPDPVAPVQDDGPSADETASEARRQSLLGRERGRFGTITTGFRGLLGLSNESPQRKTLLGE